MKLVSYIAVSAGPGTQGDLPEDLGDVVVDIMSS